MTAAPLSPKSEVFESQRGTLFGIAYRMLGSAAEAEDAVQDTWLRFHGSTDIESPRAYLTTIVSRICIDRLRSARARREVYPGTWLPEPLVEPIDAEPGPEQVAGGQELISYASMVLLETLAPAERAVFVLSEAMGFSHREIAEKLGITEAASRQTLHRARRHLADREQRYTATAEDRRRLTEAFLRASGSGDIASLTDLFAEDIVVTSDGGGKRVAALNPIHGRDRVLRFLVGTMEKEPADEVRLVRVNGDPGLVTWRRGKVQLVASFDWDEMGKLRTLHMMRNPDKYTHVRVEAAD
ncbi:MAG: RNA polymerase sigma factor SigJ [Dehalococcoidia bacterium]|nr:RNA polymerase sigma factor SigJ [Dehalococcoidia bacterium]